MAKKTNKTNNKKKLIIIALAGAFFISLITLCLLDLAPQQQGQKVDIPITTILKNS